MATSRAALARADPFRHVPWLTLAVVGWLALFPITSVDVPYHVATGRRILDEQSIPRRGVGSATFGQGPWHDNEWGFQVLAALVGGWEQEPSGVWVLSPGGIVRLILLRAACLVGTMGLVSAQMARRGVGPLTRGGAVLLTAFLTFGNLYWAIRPQILSYLGLAALAYLLERERGGTAWAGWASLAVVALWSNVHGAVVIGLALVVIEAAGETAEAWWRNDAARRARVRRLWLVAVLAPVAGCANPHGYKQLLHPLLYLFRPEIYRGNVEWTRPDLLHLPLFVLTLGLLALGLASVGRPRLADVLRCLAFTGLFLGALRHLPLAAIVIVPVLASSLAGAASRGGWRVRLEPTGPHGRGPRARAAAAAGITAVVVGLSGAFPRSGARFVSLWPRFEFRPVRTMPHNGVRLLARYNVPGSIFNEYRFGGYLMFSLYPQERVFMDGRNDLYGAFRDEVYNRILDARPGWRGLWEEAVSKFDVGAVVVDESSGLRQALRSDPAWLPFGGPDGVTDGEAGSTGVVLLLRNTPDNRGLLAEGSPLTARDR